METWAEDYFNMMGQAYIEVNEHGGEFRFGVVIAIFDGKMVTTGDLERFEFSWQGDSEGDPVNGSGWILLKDADTIEGEIRFFQGDDSGFVAKKA